MSEENNQVKIKRITDIYNANLIMDRPIDLHQLIHGKGLPLCGTPEKPKIWIPIYVFAGGYDTEIGSMWCQDLEESFKSMNEANWQPVKCEKCISLISKSKKKMITLEDFF